MEFSKNGNPLKNDKVAYKIRKGGKVTQENRRGTERTFYDENNKVSAIYYESKHKGTTNLNCKEFKDGQLQDTYNFTNGILNNHSYRKDYNDEIFNNTPFSKIFPMMKRTYPNAKTVMIEKIFVKELNDMVVRSMKILGANDEFIARFTHDYINKVSIISVTEILQRNNKEEHHKFRFENGLMVKHDHK